MTNLTPQHESIMPSFGMSFATAKCLRAKEARSWKIEYLSNPSGVILPYGSRHLSSKHHPCALGNRGTVSYHRSRARC